MAVTMQQVVDKARIPLTDAQKVRYPDTMLLGYANDALRILRTKRPDLFFGQYAKAKTELGLSDQFPIDDDFFPAVADYTSGRAHFKEDEAALITKAQSFFALFREQAS